MINLDHTGIHSAVERSDAFWDGWTAVFIDRRRDGYMDRNGIFRDGKWVVGFRYQPDAQGIWSVPKRLVRRNS